MVKRNRRLLSLLTALVMLFSLMSGFTVFAADEPNEDMYFGLMIGSPRWDETEQKPVFDESLMGSEIFPEAGYHLDFTIGWKGADGVTPFTEEDMQNVTVKDGEGQPVDIGLTRAMYSYPDETTGRWEEAPAGDGIFRCRFMTPGEYTVTYEGEQQVDGVPAGATISYMVNVHANMPVVALYSDTEISADNLIGDEVTYMPGSSSYLLAIPEMGDDNFKTETEITDIELEDRLADYVTVEEVTKGEAYKVTVSESMDQPFSIQVTYQQADYEKQEDQEFHVIREVQNDFWFNFNAPLRLGFVADWTQWSDEDPDQPVVNVENMRGLLDRYEVGEWNTFTFAWKTSGEDVTLIPLSDMDKFTAYDENGDEVTEEWIRPARHWDEDAKQEVDRGDGFFDVRFPELGQYKIVYDAGDLGAHAVLGAYWGEAVYVNAIMPEVSLYSSETISIDTLIGSRAEYKDDERTFYVNIIDDIRSDWKNVITLTGFELEGPSDVAENVNVIAANGGGYKVVISDGYTEHFNLRVFIHNSQYRLEGEEWIEDGEWDRDYWFDFEYWEPEYYGLGVGWPRFEEESLPEFTDELFTAMGMEAKADRTLCFGWKNAEGEITPIPLADIDKFHLYDPDGNEVTGDWIRYPKRWNEGEEVELGIEGMFEVAFPGTGTYVIRYDKDISGEEAPEGMAVTDACKFHVEYPDVGIYSESTISDDALIGEHVIFDQDDRVFYVISADHKDSENIFIRTIKSYEVIMPYGFEDEAENTVTVEKVNDHTLKLTVAEDTELGFDLVTELFSTNKYYDHDEKQWVDGTDTWTDERMLNFWPKEILHYGLVAGFPKPKEEGGPMGNMQQYLDGFFELYGNALVFGWRDVEGNEVQIRKDDFISYFKVLDINGNEVPYEIEMQDNGDYIYEIRFLQQGIHYLYYDGDMAVDEEVEDTICQNWVKVWVDPPILAVYDDDEFSDESLVGLDVEYQPEKLEYYIAGMHVGDERGKMSSNVTDVSVMGVENPDFVTITKNEDGTAKVVITKVPNKDYDGKFTLEVKYRIDSEWYDEMGEVVGEEHEERSAEIAFVPGIGFATSNISVNFKTEGATPVAPQIYIYNREKSTYYDLSGNVLSAANKWVTVSPGTFTIENLPLGCYNIVENEASAAVNGYDLVPESSITLLGGVMVEDGVTAKVELTNTYKAKQVIYPYRNEWKNGVWYNADGTQTYEPRGTWRHNARGYWFGDTKGWYAKKCWQRIDGKDYYFDANGYMAVDEYIDGYYLTKSGAWDGKGKAQWKGNATKGWWYSLPGGKFLKNCWAKIDGKLYYFKADGYAAKNEWVKGYYWIGANCVWSYKPKGSWHKDSKGYWFGDTSGWYAKNTTIVIDGKSYSFNARGYMK